MIKKWIPLIALCLTLSACGIIQPASTPTSTPVETSTPTPTNTPEPTPTLEPWMQSLPENVISVEQDGGRILGINAEGAQVMEYDLDKGKWVALAIGEGPVKWVRMDGLIWRENNTLDIQASGLTKVSSEWFANGEGQKYGLQKYAELQDDIAAGLVPAPPEIKYMEDLYGGKWVTMEVQDWIIPSATMEVLGHTVDYQRWLNEGDINAYPMQKSGGWLSWQDSLGEDWLVTLTWRHWKDSGNEKQVTPVYFMIHPSQIDSVSKDILSDASKTLAIRQQIEACFGAGGSQVPLLVGQITPNWPFNQVFSNGPNWVAKYQDANDNPDAARRALIWNSEAWERLSEVPWGAICIEKSE